MRSRQLLPVLVMLVLVGVVACGDEGNKSAERAVAVVEATIRHVASEHPPAEGGEAGDLPVVYVVSVGEETLSAGIQADVVSNLRDEIEVRFADAREEAIDETAPTAPVKDGGVLVVLGEIPKLGNPAVVPVEIYTARHEHIKMVYSFVPAGDVWNITSTSEVPLDAI